MTSSHEVAVYVEYSYDRFILRPLIALGSKYFTPALPTAPNVTLKTQRYFIAITSITKNTNIILRLPPQISPPLGGPFIKSNKGGYYTTLGRFQTASICSMVSFLGTKIEGNASFLVLTGIIEFTKKGKEKVLLIQELRVAEAFGKEYFVYAPDWLKGDITIHISGEKGFYCFSLEGLSAEVWNRQVWSLEGFQCGIFLQNSFVFVASYMPLKYQTHTHTTHTHTHIYIYIIK